MKLYIIGNGFDLHHGLRTSYYAFAAYLRDNNRELYDILESFVSYPTSEKDLWSLFESNLANLDAEAILSDNADYLPDLGSEDFRDRDRYTFTDVLMRIKQLLTEGLLQIFRDFILSVDYPKNVWDHKVELDINALFLTFNYTDTLEKVYGIDSSHVTYIHNCAKSDCEYLVLGHGIDPENFKEDLPEPPVGLTADELQDWYEENRPYDMSYDDGKDAIMDYFFRMYKPTTEIIKQNHSFFSNLRGVNEIYVFGHSLSEVDLPYFIEIIKHVKSVQWTVSIHTVSQADFYKNTLLDLGVQEENIKIIRLTDLMVDKAQQRLEFDD